LYGRQNFLQEKYYTQANFFKLVYTGCIAWSSLR